MLERLIEGIGAPWPRAIVLHGVEGVGKSRLANEAFAAARAAGRVGARLTASASFTGVPLGALAPLLPTEVLDQRNDAVAVYGHVAASLRARSPDEPLLLLVDDLPVLDLASVGLLGQLISEDIIFLLATARRGGNPSPGLVELWRQDHVDHVEVFPLGERDTHALVQLALGGPVDAPTRAALWSVTKGNALFLHEMVTEAAQTGALVHRQGRWQLEGPLPQPRRLIDLVETRLGGLDGAAKAAGEILALGPVSLDQLLVDVDSDTIEMLERSGSIEVHADGRRQSVQLSHPLYAELVRARMPTLTRRRLLRQRAAFIEAHGARRHDDPFAIACARLDAGGDVDPAIALQGARIARHAHDVAQVERLAGAAVAADPTPLAVLLLAEAHYDQGAGAECERVISAHEDLIGSAPPQQAVAIVGQRVRNLIYNLQRPAEALAVNEAARRRFGEDDPELLAHAASIALNDGEPRRALELVRQAPDTHWRATLMRSIVEERALIAAGAFEQAIDLTERMHALQERHAAEDDAVAMPRPDIHLANRVHALTDAGRLAEARTAAETSLDAAARTGSPAGPIWFGFHLGRIALLEGRVAEAERHLSQAATAADHGNHVLAHRLALGLLAMARTWLGDAAGARAAVDELDRLPPSAYLEPEQQLGAAWTRVPAGDQQGARRRLVEVAARAIDAGWRSSAAWIFHDLARLGDAAAAVAGLDRLADVDGRLVPAYRAHAHALASRSLPGLIEAADAFEALGAHLLAAEASRQAAATEARDERTSFALRARAAALVELCGAASTPALHAAAATATDPLTAREREIAALAAAGVPSREIAERLFVSARTVDNHLQRVYIKLGVRGRSELAGALDLTRPSNP